MEKRFEPMSFHEEYFNTEKDKYMDNLMTMSQYAWENRIDRSMIERWLENFDSDDEKIVALEILTRFVYFSEREILRLCEVAFQKLLVRIGAINNERIMVGLEDLREKYLEKCRFFGVGYPSESGHFLLYPFRQRNSLPEPLFPHITHGIDSNAQFAVFIDDIIASGDTACGFWENEVSRLASQSKNTLFFYLALLAYDKGIREIEMNTDFKVIACQIFDDNWRAFTEESSIFPEKEKRAKAREVAENYGRKAWPDWPLGFSGFQGLVGFHHNIPDTTLPIIWAKRRSRGARKGWFPIFERYEKKKVNRD